MYIYSIDSDGTITQCFEFDTRYLCEKHLKQMRRNGRMTHFYRISSLNYYDAKLRYSIS